MTPTFPGLAVRTIPTRLLTILILSVLPVTLLACQPSIELLPRAQATPYALATVSPAERGVSIVGVDFDPPLDYSQIADNGGVTLLVALENQGEEAASEVQVTARLLDPAAQGRSLELLNETVTLKSLDSGEVGVARFNQVTNLPARKRYELVVSLDTGVGVAGLTSRTYEILVRTSE